MKYKILHKLREKAPEFISGEVLSTKFKVSRTAIWKYINELKSDGYNIEASTRKGYRLVSFPCNLNQFEISYNLETAIVGREVFYFDTIDSTNNYAKSIAVNNTQDGTAIIAGSQTEGRGRLGRKWISQNDNGIYLSVILKPSMQPQDIQIITLAASVAVAAAIESATGIRTGIKWPNDIILNRKKVCGILTEMNTELDRINFVVLGIGINYSQIPSDFPEEIKEKAISLLSYAKEIEIPAENINRLNLIRTVLKELDRLYGLVLKGKSREIIDMWKNLSITINRNVRVVYRDKELNGVAVDIADDGSLVMDCDDGIRRVISSGEISVRGLLGYV